MNALEQLDVDDRARAGVSGWVIQAGLFLALMVCAVVVSAQDAAWDRYHRAKWDPIHFKPAIEQATDDQCLACHHDVLGTKPRAESPAGVKASSVLAWYQTLDTYTGDQDTFHRRHLATPFARQVMDLKCNTCHQGSDPREQSPAANDASASFTLRKTVHPKTCQHCHGQFNYQVMGLPESWPQSREAFSNNCLLCHDGIRTQRHQVNYLKADAIETAGRQSSDVCYGCHGGRSWYRSSYPYPRHDWPGMDKEVPDWARDRPTSSEPRFLLGIPAAEEKPEAAGETLLPEKTKSRQAFVEKGKK
jgi:nitrate/TMAO reductase-like tetraheme cytochrome c subunit